MNILVCVKQVPDTTAVKIDPVTNTLIRDGVPSILNPFDGFALEMALRMRDMAGGTVTVMSMAPSRRKPFCVTAWLWVLTTPIWCLAVNSAVPIPWRPATSSPAL